MERSFTISPGETIKITAAVAGSAPAVVRPAAAANADYNMANYAARIDAEAATRMREQQRGQSWLNRFKHGRVGTPGYTGYKGGRRSTRRNKKSRRSTRRRV